MTEGQPVRVLVAGTFDPDFRRNRVVMTLLERTGFEVEVVQRTLWGTERVALVNASKGKLVTRALRVYPSLLWATLRAKRPDVLLVLYPGYIDMPLLSAVARSRRVPVVFDTFISLHDTVVGDRALRSPTSLLGRATRLADRIACRRADVVIADTPPDADYFAGLADVPRDRFRVLWLGAPGGSLPSDRRCLARTSPRALPRDVHPPAGRRHDRASGEAPRRRRALSDHR